MRLLVSAQQFADYAAEGFNRAPVAMEIMADLDTPLSTYLKLADQPYTYLFESVQGGEKWGRYSFIGLPCATRIRIHDREVVVETDSGIIQQETCDDPLQFIERFQQQYRVAEAPGLPRFAGGLVGYFGYDTVRYVEPRLRDSTPQETLDTPDILLMVSEEVLIFDNLAGKLILLKLADPAEDHAYDQAVARLSALAGDLAQLQAKPPQSPANAPTLAEADFESAFPQGAFEAAVARIKDYVLAGDVMQAVISQRLSIGFEAPPLNLYRALRCLNPSPYMYFLNLGDFHIVGSSPEILTHVEDGMVTVRPIAGTRKRGSTEAKDLALEQELLADPKEIAEHLMLIDLGRNDIGRVSATGSVKLTENMVVERYSHVMHIVSNVCGELLPGQSSIDVLRATLPAGTLSGAPKVRAMEIIDELEPVKRGVYGGAVGYLAWNGNMDTAIAIRTAVVKDNTLYVQAGAGVVADSVPALEWKETMNKARAIFRAAAMAQTGLDHAVDDR